ncbi:MAG: hypothetical protein O8C64_04510 [Candidatus Methanoperedens sp.]|nr:hypothetical protein [Candidatus Methanoperedens sp.]MCZ7405196.1 hypothetical protein [Candidatus Methanoperedens sp.]
MNAKTIVAIAAILVVLAAGYAVAKPESGFWSDMMGSYGHGYGNGMMGNGRMIGGYGGMMGTGGMMGYGSNYFNGMMGNGNSAGYCGAAYDDINENATQ